MNRLANEKSAYLKHAAHQKIDWYPWSDEAFERARLEDKPVFLSTGAVWCHWCHVMAKESFETDEAARLLNELFICIKLDRDERPDIDRRYQQAAAAMGSGGGWPLSIFLTPDKEPFFGGTYFPPEDIQGRPGFKKVLKAVSDFYKTKRGDAGEYARKVMDTLRPEALAEGDIAESVLAEAEIAMLSLDDHMNGGFGTAPKFPMPGAVEFFLRRSAKSTDSSAGRAARRMLEAMVAGGFHDHLGGGFHRYSTDEAWIVPHFEKMADDNAGLLKNYVDGYAMFGDERFREVAMGVIRFIRDVLSDPAGGFYASQDADVTPDDEGGYFTWTEEEFKSVLDPEEYAVLANFLLHDLGSMHHAPEKKVLFAPRSLNEIAGSLGKEVDDLQRLVQSGKKKLLTARAQRKAPFVDTTLYTSLNGMLISAYFHAYAVLGDERVREFGVTSLERILRERLVSGRLMHAEDVPASLDDYVHLIDALTAAYEATAQRPFLQQADELMTVCLEKFYDNSEGGFFDTEEEVLGTRLKRIEDIPHSSANAVAIMVLLRLFLLTGKDAYRRSAEQTLRIFSSVARDMSIHAGSYFCALEASFRMIKLTVEAVPEGNLAKAARALAGRTYATIVYGEDNGRVIPCLQDVCYEPVHDAGSLREVFAKL
jgi:uncharacterized protein YyaL (SSP411 family)